MIELDLEIEEISERYTQLIMSLSLIHEKLEDLRDNLPHIFLTKKGIKKFIDSNNEKRNKKIKKIESKLKEVLIKINSEKDPLKKKKLENLKDKYKSRIQYTTGNYMNHDSLDQYFYEDIILLTSNGRFEASTSFKKAILVNGQLDKYEKYYSKKLKIEGAEDFLQGKVANVTESMKNAYVDSHKGLLKLRLLCAEAKSLDDSFSNLIKQFEYDIGNFRRFYEKNNTFNTF